MNINHVLVTTQVTEYLMRAGSLEGNLCIQQCKILWTIVVGLNPLFDIYQSDSRSLKQTENHACIIPLKRL